MYVYIHTCVYTFAHTYLWVYIYLQVYMHNLHMCIHAQVSQSFVTLWGPHGPRMKIYGLVQPTYTSLLWMQILKFCFLK